MQSSVVSELMHPALINVSMLACFLALYVQTKDIIQLGSGLRWLIA